MMPHVLIVADDLTGAADTGAQFARRGWRTLLALRRPPSSLYPPSSLHPRQGGVERPTHRAPEGEKGRQGGVERPTHRAPEGEKGRQGGTLAPAPRAGVGAPRAANIRREAEDQQNFDEHTLVINLISGGGSALFDGLIEFTDGGQTVALTLADLQQTTSALLACGATITEINCLRKHISTVKGGRLVRLLYPATSLNFILSDVIGDRLDAIASGLTVPDRSTFGEALEIVQKYGVAAQLPAAVRRALELGAAGQLAETPKPGDPIFERTHNLLIGTLYHSLLAAAEEARALGYHPLVLSAQLTGEARELAKVLLGMARDVTQHGLLAPRPACLIGGGETTVTLRGSGKGGRNQEMALSFLCELKTDPDASREIYFLSASTDGSDGPTDAAGAFASWELYRTALARGLKPEAYLQNNDSYHFYETVDALLKTGPTGTNVCDLQIMLVC